MITVVSYGPDFEASHREFATKYWKKRKRTTPRYIYWKFRGKPGAELTSFILAMDGERVVGQLGLIPCNVKVGDRLVDAQWICDLFIDESYRGGGVAKLLYQHALTMKTLTLGSDPSQPAAVSLRRFGFERLPGPTKCLFPVNLGAIFRLKGMSIGFLDRIPNPFYILLLIIRAVGPRVTERPIVNEFAELNPVFIEGKAAEIYVDHDFDFWQWRGQPFEDFYLGLIDVSSSRDSAASLYPSDEAFIVGDFRFKRTLAALSMIAHIALGAFRAKSGVVKMMANRRFELTLLVLCGFIPFRTETEVVFFSCDIDLMSRLRGGFFTYTYLDSDENI